MSIYLFRIYLLHYQGKNVPNRAYGQNLTYSVRSGPIDDLKLSSHVFIHYLTLAKIVNLI